MSLFEIIMLYLKSFILIIYWNYNILGLLVYIYYIKVCLIKGVYRFEVKGYWVRSSSFYLNNKCGLYVIEVFIYFNIRNLDLNFLLIE